MYIDKISNVEDSITAIVDEYVGETEIAPPGELDVQSAKENWATIHF